MTHGRGKKLDATKHPQNREAWLLKKREGRPKQTWALDVPLGETRWVEGVPPGSTPPGHWEKVNVPSS